MYAERSLALQLQCIPMYLGWVLSGPVNIHKDPVSEVAPNTTLFMRIKDSYGDNENTSDLYDQIKNVWELKSIGIMQKGESVHF